MDPTTTAVLAERIGRLERQLRWWKRSVVAGALVVAAGLLTTPVVPSDGVLQTAGLVVRGPSGAVRSSLQLLEDGSTVLKFADDRERDRLAIGVLGDGSPVMSFYDEQRRRRAAVGLVDDSPGIQLYGRDGTVRGSVALVKDGLPGLRLHGRDGTLRAGLVVGEDDVARLAIVDGSGRLRWQAPPTP